MAPYLSAFLIMGLPAGVGIYAITVSKDANDRQFGAFLLVYSIGIALVSHQITPRYRPASVEGMLHVPVIFLICLSVGLALALWRRLRK